MKIAKWSCTTCGMSSGRKFSVQRHIQNYGIHNGEGKAIPFVEYAVGRRQGYYEPARPSNSHASESLFLNEIYKKAAKEAENLIVKDIALRIYTDLSQNQTAFQNFKILTEAYLLEKNNFYRYLKELQS